MSTDENQPKDSGAAGASEPETPTIGKYPISEKIGKGAMGEVWLGRHPDLDIPIAIKVLPAHLVSRDAVFAYRFVKEARTAAKIEHVNVIRTYDVGSDEETFFLVMEYVDGGTVKQLVDREGGKLPPERALDIIIGLSEGLEAAAHLNIIHRDIKPDNIMLDSSGVAKLADLGLAKQIGGDGMGMSATSITTSGLSMGTPKYMSPEQAQDFKAVDARADIYSLGGTFYYLVTGEPPFDANTPVAMIMKHVREPLVPPRAVNPDVPESISAVVCKMMEKDPEDRYQSAAELLGDLRKIRDEDAPVSELLAGLGVDRTIPSTRPALGEKEEKEQKKKDRKREKEKEKEEADEAPEASGNGKKLGLIIGGAVVGLVVLVMLLASLFSGPSGGQAAAQAAADAREDGAPAAAPPTVGKPWTTPDLGLELAPVAAGSFKMRSDAIEGAEGGVVSIRLPRPFWMGKCEVTQEAFAKFVQAAGRKTGAERQGAAFVWENDQWRSKAGANWVNTFPGPRRPVVCVSWHDASEFCKWLTAREAEAGRLPEGCVYRLPTEAEWEYCCRAGRSGKDAAQGSDEGAWHAGNSNQAPHDVGAKKANAWGLHDMHGNAWEWCQDWYGPLPTGTVEDAGGPKIGADRVCRGGSWQSGPDWAAEDVGPDGKKAKPDRLKNAREWLRRFQQAQPAEYGRILALRAADPKKFRREMRELLRLRAPPDHHRRRGLDPSRADSSIGFRVVLGPAPE